MYYFHLTSLQCIPFMFPTATKKNDKKGRGSSDASESEEEDNGDESPVKQHSKKEKLKKITLATCNYLFLYFNASFMVFFVIYFCFFS
jgi:hypothetical protein